MSLKIIVLAKQVPDTRNVGPDAMTPEGTVNRAALPAVFNPEDLNALEQALRLKDANPGSTITMLTMGLPKAAEVLKEGIYRGADEGILISDRTPLPLPTHWLRLSRRWATTTLFFAVVKPSMVTLHR